MSQLNVTNILATGVVTCTTPTTGPGAVNVVANSVNAGCRIRFLNSSSTLELCSLNATSANVTCNGNVTAYSDIRFKENIEDITNPLQKVLSIRGVTFTRTDFPDNKKRHLGVIAQELEQVLPEVVHVCPDTDSEGNPIEVKTVAYGNIVSILVEAIKEQNKEIEDLKNRVKILETR